MASESGSRIGDMEPQAQLVECVPEGPQPLSVDVSAVCDVSPVQQAMEATIAQTGADPPPAGAQHG
jgi:hypothetical protein